MLNILIHNTEQNDNNKRDRILHIDSFSECPLPILYKDIP